MQQCSKPVLHRHLLDDLHDRNVLVDLCRYAAVHGRELVLVRRHLSVAGAQWDAQLETLLLDLLHTGQCRGGQRDGRHVCSINSSRQCEENNKITISVCS